MKSLLPAAMVVLAASTSAWADEPDSKEFGTAPRVALGADLTDEQRLAIWDQIARNTEMLKEQGILPKTAPALLATHPTLDWPLRAPALNDPGYHRIWQFVDHNPAFPNQLQDYACGTRTYDNAGGYNHQGTDYGIWPFEWLRLDQGVVQVVAAAPGIIVGRDDGHPDHSCVQDPSAQWNAVYIQHADGSYAWYGHMKNGSQTAKPIGASVAAGEYLGLVASAGNSNVPHLHLEVYDSASALNDPYTGTCNNFNPTTWWISQRPYYDSALNRFASGYGGPIFAGCPNEEDPREANDFNPGDRAVFVTYFRDQLAGQTSTNTLRRPDGTVFSTWTDNPTSAFEDATWWLRMFGSFAPSGPLGVWRYDVTYLGKTYSRHFRVSAATGVGRVPGDLDDDVPVRVGKSGANVSLSWAASCVPTDTDYEVYEGTIGNWTSHTPEACSTAGATSTAFAPGAGSTYYLVVPTNGANEGSYGFTGAWAERPLGAASCHAQVIGGSCPHCGDARLESPEVCDQDLLNGQTCITLGFTGGDLLCKSDCTAFDTSLCF